jgi:hypothetical protein
MVYLVGFYAVTMLIFTMYGGGFSTIPAYIADVFGTKYVSAIHGRLLTAWSTAGVIGPLAITMLRGSAVNDAIQQLASVIDPARFEARFGAGMDQLATLVEGKTVTIAKLMEIAPAGTVDPTPGLYNTTMYLMAGLLFVALLANAFMGAVDAKHHMADAPEPSPAPNLETGRRLAKAASAARAPVGGALSRRTAAPEISGEAEDNQEPRP